MRKQREVMREVNRDAEVSFEQGRKKGGRERVLVERTEERR